MTEIANLSQLKAFSEANFSLFLQATKLNGSSPMNMGAVTSHEIF